MNSRRVASLLGVAFCAAVLGCREEAPDWESIIPKEAAAHAAPQVLTADELVVYLDASKSIQGYVRPDGATTYGTTLRELRNFSSLLTRPLRVTVRRVDGSISGKAPDVELNRASMSRAVYSGSETNLAGAFSQFGPNLVAAGSPPAMTPVPILQVLVTDGVQSTDRSVIDADCAAGSDQVCVRGQMLRWINSGWSAVLLGIRSEFDGTIYSEINRLSTSRPYGIQYTTSSGDRSSYRPFYLYAFSPDQRTLTQFAATLKRRLQAADKNVVIRELPINVRYTTGPATARVTSNRAAPQLISVEGGKQTPIDRVSIRLDAAESRPVPHPVVLRVSIPWSADAADMGTNEELGRSLTWEVVAIEGTGNKVGRRPDVRLGTATVNKDGTIDVPLDPHWPPGTGERTWAAFAVRAKLNFDEDAPQWVRDWSTDLDTNATYGNRTLFLESAVLGLWRNSKVQSRSIGEIYVRIGP